MNKTLLAIIGGAVVIVVGFVGYKAMSLKSEAAKWSGPMREIAEEEIVHEGTTTKSRFVTVIDAPIARVEALVWDVENLSHTVSNFKVSRLIEGDANKKKMEIAIQALTLPTLSYEMEFVIDRDAHRVTFKTVKSQAQDIDGEYQLQPSPDGSKTRMEYKTVARDKVAVPFPQSVLDGAARETFVNTVRAIQKMVKPS